MTNSDHDIPGANRAADDRSGFGRFVRARLGLFVVCIAAACGGPSTPVQPSTPILPSGAYRLTLTMTATGDPICTGEGCSAASLCANTDGVQLIGVTVPIDVRAERTGDDVAIQPVDASATFRMKLRISAIALSGTALGQFRSGGQVVAIDGGEPQSVGMVTGIAAPGPRVAAGTLEGAIMIGGAGCSNKTHRWSLDLPLSRR